MSWRAGMFERLRAKPREWLLLRPPATADGVWQWMHYAAQQVQASGTWPPPTTCLQLPGALVIPALACSHFCLPAPPGLKRHEWPQLFEEYAQQPAEELLVSCLSREAGHLELLVMQRQQVQDWLVECAALGVQISHGWAELQLLPQPAPGYALSWQREQLLCVKASSRQWLIWPQVLGERLPQAWRELSIEPLTGDWPSRLARLEQVPCVLEDARPLRTRVRRTSVLTGVQRRLLLGCGLLAACWGAIYLLQIVRQLDDWQAQVKAVAAPANNLSQARAALARLNNQTTDWRVRQQQVASLEQALSTWLQQQPGWFVSSNRFDGRVWRVGLSGSGPQPATGEWQAIAEAAGAQWLEEPQGLATGMQLSFDLGVQP
ncbi:type II secretion system protein GspL [Pseudomonas sp. 15FMM2]|uniref:Type II secretion system protein GspL n=1 Tax=Pseudomonas imrae TaxID=2992837 RepID=A0ACC7PNZ2_9PSED